MSGVLTDESAGSRFLREPIRTDACTPGVIASTRFLVAGPRLDAAVGTSTPTQRPSATAGEPTPPQRPPPPHSSRLHVKTDLPCDFRPALHTHADFDPPCDSSKRPKATGHTCRAVQLCALTAKAFEKFPKNRQDRGCPDLARPHDWLRVSACRVGPGVWGINPHSRALLLIQQ